MPQLTFVKRVQKLQFYSVAFHNYSLEYLILSSIFNILEFLISFVTIFSRAGILSLDECMMLNGSFFS